MLWWEYCSTCNFHELIIAQKLIAKKQTTSPAKLSRYNISLYANLSYGFVSQAPGTNKLTSFIGWNGYSTSFLGLMDIDYGLDFPI